MEVMKGSGQGLMQQLASTVAAAQVSRSSQTVGTRFRDQLKDLITRLDQSAHHPFFALTLVHATFCMCTTWCLCKLQLHLQ
jgi:K+-transporting ATPase c subunit